MSPITIYIYISSKELLFLTLHSQGGRAPTPPMLSRGSLNARETPPVCYYLSLFSAHWSQYLLNRLTILRLLLSSGTTHDPTLLLGLFTLTIYIYIYIYIQIFICYVIEMTSITFVLMLICKFFHNKIGNKFNILKDKIMIWFLIIIT